MDTFTVFCYQGAIFYVQLEVYNNMTVCDAESCWLQSPTNVFSVWLYIEIYCFYLYMASTVFYIAYHQLVEGVCFRKE